MAKWFPSVSTMEFHVKGLLKILMVEEKERFPRLTDGKPPPAPEVIMWAMEEAKNSTDPAQRARWSMYRGSVQSTPSGPNRRSRFPP